MLPKVSRRQFIQGAAAAAAVWPRLAEARQGAAASPLFRHGVASGDPLPDRVMIWTRVTSPAGATKVRWRVATDEKLSNVIASATVETSALRDHTVKVDVPGLSPGRTYYYAFDADGDMSAVGRTKTLPEESVERVRLATVSCSNYPAGYFNVYRCVANRADLDAVLHLGDYIYEFANGVYGDGADSGRIPMPAGEASTLADYRWRYATYRTDIDLQAVHAAHPFIAVWDDHEIVNDAWRGGAPTHKGSEADWRVRQACGLPGVSRMDAGTRVHRPWHPVVPGLPVRPPGGSGDAGHARPPRSAGAAARRRRRQCPGPDAARARSGGVALRQPSAIAAGGHGMAAARPADSLRAAHAHRHRAAERGRVGRLPGRPRACVRLPGTGEDLEPRGADRRHPQLVGDGRAAQSVSRLHRPHGRRIAGRGAGDAGGQLAAVLCRRRYARRQRRCCGWRRRT